VDAVEQACRTSSRVSDPPNVRFDSIQVGIIEVVDTDDDYDD
jgi:hypothetical protein